MTDKELQEIARLQKESSGYMEIVPNHYTPNRNKIRMGEQEIWIGTGSIEQTAIDYEYISKACNSVPEMVKEIKHLQRMVDWLANKLVERGHIIGDISSPSFMKNWIAAARKASENEA